mmetsp:Transcript_895/g.1159  ORF Transcript_895/g.1159 Transcript_895/m.1159 type:complete len:131 (-) Transcript_895:217-609(-)
MSSIFSSDTHNYFGEYFITYLNGSRGKGIQAGIIISLILGTLGVSVCTYVGLYMFFERRGQRSSRKRGDQSVESYSPPISSAELGEPSLRLSENGISGMDMDEVALAESSLSEVALGADTKIDMSEMQEI